MAWKVLRKEMRKERDGYTLVLVVGDGAGREKKIEGVSGRTWDGLEIGSDVPFEVR